MAAGGEAFREVLRRFAEACAQGDRGAVHLLIHNLFSDANLVGGWVGGQQGVPVAEPDGVGSGERVGGADGSGAAGAAAAWPPQHVAPLTGSGCIAATARRHRSSSPSARACPPAAWACHGPRRR